MNILLIQFIILNIANVIIQTIKSIATIKCGKGVAALANAIAYGLYTIVVIYMVCELPLWQKVLIVGGANLVGVYIVKALEEKGKKSKLWKIEVTALQTDKEKILNHINNLNISYNYIDIDNKYVNFNFYCSTKEDTTVVKDLLNWYNVKYIILENKGAL